MTPAEERVGSWLSAALDDPKVCQEMKDDITAWMDEVFISRGEPTERDWLTRERDEAIAQRDRAGAELKALARWCNTPIPNRLAAERAAGRQQGLEEAAKVVELNMEGENAFSGKYLAPRCDGNTMGLGYAVGIRALRDTPAPLETGKT